MKQTETRGVPLLEVIVCSVPDAIEAERGSAGRPPSRERRAVHDGERLAGGAGHQHVAAVDRRP